MRLRIKELEREVAALQGECPLKMDSDYCSAGTCYRCLTKRFVALEKEIAALKATKATPVAWIATNTLNGDILHFSVEDHWKVEVVASEQRESDAGRQDRRSRKC